MAVIRKDLGTVTAYAYAVSKGYTGTEAEFAELMASYAEVAEEAAQSASDAENAAERAEAAAETLTVDGALSDTSVNPVQNKVITGELTDVKSAIDNIEYNAFGITRESVSLTADTRIGSAPTKAGIAQSAKTGYQSAVIDCSAGDLYDIYCDTQSTSYETYGFYYWDADNSYYKRLTHASTLTGKTRITVPAHAEKLIINNNSTYVANPSVEKIVLENEDAIEQRIDSLEAIVAKNANHICFLRRGMHYRTRTKQIYIPSQQYLFDGTRRTVASQTVNISAFANYFAVYYDSSTDTIGATSNNFILSDTQYLIGAFDARMPEAGIVFGRYSINGFEVHFGERTESDEALENVASDWWIYPFTTRYQGMRDKIYVGYIDSNAVCGVIAIDKASGRIQRKNLYISDAADEHNAPSVSILPDGKIMVICTNHATSPYHVVFISTKPESITDFTSYSLQTAHDGVTYSQVVKMGATYYLFYRAHDYVEGSTTTDKYHWCVRTSTDGLTWTDEVTWLTGGTVQYYILARPYDSTRIKVFMQGNASGSYTDIRLCYIDTTTGDILDADLSTAIGNLSTLAEPISFESFTVILAKTSTYKNRLLSVAPGTDLSFTCGRIASASNYSVYIYRYAGGSWTANTIPDVGASFGGGSNSTYINHAEIVGVENGVYTIVYAAQTASGWELRKVEVSSTAGTPTVLKSTASAVKIIRPFKVIDDSAVMPTIGTWTDYDDYYGDFYVVDI